jgi:hypothetical protein
VLIAGRYYGRYHGDIELETLIPRSQRRIRSGAWSEKTSDKKHTAIGQQVTTMSKSASNQLTTISPNSGIGIVNFDQGGIQNTVWAVKVITSRNTS